MGFAAFIVFLAIGVACGVVVMLSVLYGVRRELWVAAPPALAFGVSYAAIGGEPHDFATTLAAITLFCLQMAWLIYRIGRFEAR